MVSKPATIPVHPCGAYRYNSVLQILQKERPDLFQSQEAGREGAAAAGAGASTTGGGKPSAGLHVIYRLDRLTSGLLILAKSPEEASRMCAELQSGWTKKYYLALVKGDFASHAFPSETAAGEPGGEGVERSEVLFEDWCVGETEAGAEEGKEEGEAGGEEGEGGRPVKKKQKKRRRDGDGGMAATGNAEAEAEAEAEVEAPMQWRVQSDGSVDVQAGIRCVSYRDAVYECSAQGKPSRTLFRPLGFDGVHSLVACRPITGRTHQVRRVEVGWVARGMLMCGGGVGDWH